MFDIGFSEIVVIGVVALVVIGPERLPKTARTMGLLFGRLQRYVNSLRLALFITISGSKPNRSERMGMLFSRSVRNTL